MSKKNIHFIINPSSGKSAPPYELIGNAIAQHEHQCFIHMTTADTPIDFYVETALNMNADLIVSYGGDGTVMGIANALYGHDTPMAIMAGGTANVVAHDLNIPVDPQQALDLIFGDNHEVVCVDAGRVNDQHFLLRFSLGWEAEMSTRPSSDDKTKWGNLAYAQASLESLGDLESVTYELTLDNGQVESVAGINCSICNIGNIGYYGLSIGKDVSADDGYLDILIVQNQSLQAVVDVAKNVLGNVLEIEEELPHYKAKKLTIHPSGSQRMSCDGEPFEAEFPLTIECIPNFATIIVPPADETERTNN